MTVTLDYQRPSSTTLVALEDRFEVLKEIGDGSFGSVALARVRANGANIARRGSLVGTTIPFAFNADKSRSPLKQ